MTTVTEPRRSLAVAAVLVAFGSSVVAVASRIPLAVATDPLGPRLFPMALGAGIALCGLLLAGAALVFRGTAGRAGLLSSLEGGEEADGGPVSPGRLIGAVVATALYVAAFEPLGYLLSTPPYIAAIMLIAGGVGGRALLSAPPLITLALYAAFRFGLLIPIPDGILEAVLRW